MVFNWTPEAEARMFLAVIKTSEAIKFDNTAIAEYMGPDVTAKAVSHRVAKLKANAKDLTKEWTPGVAPAPKTPKTPNKRSNADANGEQDGNDTPTSKKAKTPRSTRGKGKKVVAEENGVAEADGDAKTENGASESEAADGVKPEEDADA